MHSRWKLSFLIATCAVLVLASSSYSETPVEAPPTDSLMVLIPSGEFTMGSVSGEGDDNERPQHRVNVSAFYIDRYEVTNAQFRRFIEAGGYTDRNNWSDEGWRWRRNVTEPEYWSDGNPNFGEVYPQYPVVGVSWYEAEAYARWAGKRLPTEAEWEKAARGTDGRMYPWGNEEPTCERAVFRGCGTGPWEMSFGRLRFACRAVGSCAAGRSPYGVEDMAGNVWEWVADWKDNKYYSKSPVADPPGPTTGRYRVVRGGAWNLATNNLGSARRGNYYNSYPKYRDLFIGFRCARSLP
jgi:formylglycine-generating enzyme required for sulfatase activity